MWEVASLVCFALCVFALAALVTHHPGDPSILSNSREAARNACGKVGANLSAITLQLLGLGAFVLPAALFFLASSLYKREGSLRLFGTLGGMCVTVVALSVFLTLQWKFWPYAGTLILTGGAIGAYLADILLGQFAVLGASIVSLVVFCLALAVSTPISVVRMGATMMSFVAEYSWRAGKLVASYALYVVGLVLMKLAHKSGDAIQLSFDRAMAAARVRRAMWADKRQQRAIAARNPVVVADEDDSDEEEEETEAAEPEIGLEASHSASGNAFEESFEAPNALPELETSPAVAASVSSALQILTRDHDQAPKLAGEAVPMEIGHSTKASAAAKAAKLLARAARLKKGNWKLPTVEFLKKPPKIESSIDRDKLLANSQILKQKFADFGIDGEVTAVRPGPVITLYEFKPGPGIKVSRIAALADDLSMALSAQSVRILAPLPGKAVVGIEIPSDNRETVYLREFLQHPDFYGPKHSLPIVMGKDIGGQTYLSDLARMPHLLCAGQTGSGKSVFMNGLICSLLYRFTPDDLRLILVDPKFIEFRAYQDIPHLLLPVVDDPKHAATALKWAVREMDRRYRILARIGARNLATFNQKVDEMGAEVINDLLCSEDNQSEGTSATSQSGTDWMEAFEPDESGAPRVGKLPNIVVIIDELADLMMIARKEVEISIARIAQKARAAGIHLVVATQRPSTDVVTGLIKANLPSRVSFQLASFVDSKTILDRSGAERLLGQGDMLFIPPGVSQNLRLHGAFVDDDEIGKITSFLKGQGKPAYRDEILVDEDELAETEGEDPDDEMFQEGVELVKRAGHASASFLQRHLKVGYNRAARMIETMEARGIVGPADGARPREVLIR